MDKGRGTRACVLDMDYSGRVACFSGRLAPLLAWMSCTSSPSMICLRLPTARGFVAQLVLLVARTEISITGIARLVVVEKKDFNVFPLALGKEFVKAM